MGGEFWGEVVGINGWLVLGLLRSKIPQNDNLEDSWFFGNETFRCTSTKLTGAVNKRSGYIV